MEIRRALLLACLALFTVALTVPAGAVPEEGELTDAGMPVEGEIELEAEGEEQIVTLGSGVRCKAVYDYTVIDGKVVVVTDRIVDTKSCVGLGTYANCKVKTDKNIDLPWLGTVTKDGVDFVDATVEYSFEGCNEPKVKLLIPSAALKVDNKAAIGEFTLETSGTVFVGEAETELPTTVTGTYELLSAAGTYEIE